MYLCEVKIDFDERKFYCHNGDILDLANLCEITTINGSLGHVMLYIWDNELREKIHDITGLYFARYYQKLILNKEYDDTRGRDLLVFGDILDNRLQLNRDVKIYELTEEVSNDEYEHYSTTKPNKTFNGTFDIANLHYKDYDQIENEFGRAFFEDYYEIWSRSHEKVVYESLKVGDLIVPLLNTSLNELITGNENEAHRIFYRVVQIKNGLIATKKSIEGMVPKIIPGVRRSDIDNYFNISDIERVSNLYKEPFADVIYRYGVNMGMYLSSEDLYELVMDEELKSNG